MAITTSKVARLSFATAGIKASPDATALNRIFDILVLPNQL
ncbi:hypothetical protein [Dehalobacter sp.]|nr:hypothetical protein [Dehalobacter sp.]